MPSTSLYDVAKAAGDPLEAYLEMFGQIIIMPLILLGRRVSSIIFLTGSVLYIISAVVVSVFSGVPITGLQANSYRSSASSSSSSEAYLKPFEFVKSTMPRVMDNFLEDSSLDQDDCPQMIKSKAACSVNQDFPYYTYIVNHTVTENGFLGRFLDPESKIFITSLVGSEYCHQQQQFRCRQVNIYQTIYRYIINKIKNLLWKGFLGTMFQSPNIMTTTSTTTTTTTTPSPLAWIPSDIDGKSIRNLLEKFVQYL